MPSLSTEKHSIDSAARTRLGNSPVATWSTANGCAGKGDGSTHANNCGSRTRASAPWAPTDSPSAPDGSWSRPVKRFGNARSRPETTSHRRKLRSRDSPEADNPIPRSPPSSSSAREPSNGTFARCSPSSASAHARNSGSSRRTPQAPSSVRERRRRDGAINGRLVDCLGSRSTPGRLRRSAIATETVGASRSQDPRGQPVTFQPLPTRTMHEDCFSCPRWGPSVGSVNDDHEGRSVVSTSWS